jgi:Beta-galactosidase jelly roll domain
LKHFFSFLFLFIFSGNLGFGQVIKLNGSWKFRIGDKITWASPTYDDSDWETIIAPSAWEEEGFNGYDGFAWYRKKFDGKKLSKEETYYINLGYIDDTDEVYLNGKLIGLSGSMPPKFKTAYNSERKYSLPNDIIDFTKENNIAIRVFDVTQGGGIIDGQLGIYRAPKSRMLVDLKGLWDFTTSKNSSPVKPDKEWNKIMVPSPWEQQGYPHYDGFAWYRRSFTMDTKLTEKEEDLVLLLGKIDDFDKAFLNGKMIGRTYDGESFGDSESYSQFRAYTIPAGLLKKTGLNTIEVVVEDMGNVGGIYEGPIGISTRTVYERYYR